MARLNLTIPDALYARLDRLRDRVNASKVCAIALEKELDMLEGQTAPVDPRLQRLVQRLQRQQGNRERWYQHGYEDGEKWAIDVASQEELQWVAGEWGDNDRDYEDVDQSDLPRSFLLWASVQKWLVADLKEAGAGASNLERARFIAGQYVHGIEAALKLAVEEAVGPAERAAVKKTFEEVDKRAYLNGWHFAVRDIWKAVAPVLQRPGG